MQNPICIIAAINLYDRYWIAPLAINFQIDPALGIDTIVSHEPNLAYQSGRCLFQSLTIENGWPGVIHKVGLHVGSGTDSEFTQITSNRWNSLMENLAQYKTWVENVQAFVPKPLEFKEPRSVSEYMAMDGVTEILFFNFNQPIGVDDVIALKENPTD